MGNHNGKPVRLGRCSAVGAGPLLSVSLAQSGNISSIEYVMNADLCRRLSRSVNMIASKNPVKAPKNASVIERLLKFRKACPVKRNPVYAIAGVQKISRVFVAVTRPSILKIVAECG